MFRNYFTTALRIMQKNKLYSLINILGLAMGMACAFLIFLWIEDELNFDLFHKKADRIYRIVSHYHGSASIYVPGPLSLFLKAEVPEIENATRVHSAEGVFQYQENIIRLKGLWAEPQLLDIFTFPAKLGDAKTALDQPGQIVITEEAAHKLFSDEDPINKIIKIDDQHTAQIAAVLEHIPDKSSPPLQFDYLLPFKILYSWRQPDSWSASSDYTNFILRTANSSPEIIEQKIQLLFDKYKIDPQWKLSLQPITDVHLHSNFDADLAKNYGDNRYVILFSIIASLILVIACFNYVNLATAFSLLRTKEIGVRKIIGAHRFQIISQILFETMLISGVAALLALLIVELLLPAFNQITNKEIAIDYSDISLMIKFLALIVLAGFLSGWYPAVLSASIKPLNILKKLTINLGKKSSFISMRKLLVLFQFAVTIAVLVGTFVVWQQLHFIKNKKLGFSSENLIYIPASWSLNPTVFEAFKNELLSHPGIVSACKSGHVPNYDIRFQTITTWMERGDKRSGNFRGFLVDYDFLNTFKINLIHGRFFSPEFTTDKTSAFVINETAAKQMSMEKPIGQSLEMHGRKGTIIGVMEDFHFASLKEPIAPLIFMYDDAARFINIRLSSSDWDQSIKFIEKQIKQFIPSIPFTFHFWDETIEGFYQAEHKLQKLFTYFTVLAFLISCLGLFGLVSFITKRKTKEIGIRKVLGASGKSIVFSTFREFFTWILLANAIAIPIGWYAMTNWLQNFAYRIDISWWVFLLAGTSVLMIALLTVNYQAIKAALANPVEALRCE